MHLGCQCSCERKLKCRHDVADVAVAVILAVFQEHIPQSCRENKVYAGRTKQSVIIGSINKHLVSTCDLRENVRLGLFCQEQTFDAHRKRQHIPIAQYKLCA